MRLRRPSPSGRLSWTLPQLPHLLLTLLAFAPAQIRAADATELDCAKVEVGDHTYDFSPLTGPHSVVTSKHHAPSFTNTTWTLDLCGPLKRAGEVDEGMGCADGTRGTSSQTVNFSDPYSGYADLVGRVQSAQSAA
jgi:hypothetical protein